MHLLLTDRLTCPRCGPPFGLILLADRMTDRRVHQGTLGCPNCRDSFSVDDGFADLRAPPRGTLPKGLAGPDPGDVEADSAARSADPHGAGPFGAMGGVDAGGISERLVALLGIHRGPGTVVFTGRAARHAASVTVVVDDLEAAAVDPDTRGWAEAPSVSRMVAAPGLPFYSRMLRGAVVDAAAGRGIVFEGARVVAPRSRVVVLHAEEDTVAVLEEAGLEIMAAESGTVVATRG
ncbi:MAG: hypothetical protein HKN72_07465 [Gemmatimonadetes bacterium]|nr:hypothetical protein [Gemmatimonadota bacterium]